MDGKRRADIRPGQQVEIVLKKDQPTGRRTRGVVRRILTNSPTHPHGIKVMLEEGGLPPQFNKILKKSSKEYAEEAVSIYAKIPVPHRVRMLRERFGL